MIQSLLMLFYYVLLITFFPRHAVLCDITKPQNSVEKIQLKSEIKHGLRLDTLNGESKEKRQGSLTITFSLSTSEIVFHFSSKESIRKYSNEQEKSE